MYQTQLLAQRLAGPDSVFAPYVSALPIGVAGVPMFFPRPALDALEYPPVVEQVKRRGRWLSRFSQDVLAKLPGTADDPFGGVTVDINSLGASLASDVRCPMRIAQSPRKALGRSCFSAMYACVMCLAEFPGPPAAGWALAVVTSRAFRVAGPTAPAALLPLIDMANHSFTPNAEVVPTPGGGVAMVAKTKVGTWAAG